MRVTSPAELTQRIEEIRKAQREFAKFSQDQMGDNCCMLLYGYPLMV